MKKLQHITIIALLLVGLVGLSWIVFSDNSAVNTHSKRPIVIYCAAGLSDPIEEIAAEFDQLHSLNIELNFGGSGELLSKLEIHTGDIYIPADELHLDRAHDKDLLTERVRLVKLTPSLVYHKNTAGVSGLKDLTNPNISVVLADQTAAIGVISHRILKDSGVASKVYSGSFTSVPTVMSVINQLQIGAADAGVAWRHLEQQFPELRFIELNEASYSSHAAAGLLKNAQHNQAAREFMSFLRSATAQKIFRKHGFQLNETQN